MMLSPTIGCRPDPARSPTPWKSTSASPTPGPRDLQAVDSRADPGRSARRGEHTAQIKPRPRPTTTWTPSPTGCGPRSTGIVATHTTISRAGCGSPTPQVDDPVRADRPGPLVADRSLEAAPPVRADRREARLVSVGASAPSTRHGRILAGADLLQIYTGFIYGARFLVKRSTRASPNGQGSGFLLRRRRRRDGFSRQQLNPGKTQGRPGIVQTSSACMVPTTTARAIACENRLKPRYGVAPSGRPERGHVDTCTATKYRCGPVPGRAVPHPRNGPAKRVTVERHRTCGQAAAGLVTRTSASSGDRRRDVGTAQQADVGAHVDGHGEAVPQLDDSCATDPATGLDCADLRVG